MKRFSLPGNRQQKTYAAINACNDAEVSIMFSVFMFSSFKSMLIDAITASDEVSTIPLDNATMRWK